MIKQTISKAIKVIDSSKWRLILMVGAFILASLIDVIGIGLIGPYVSLISNESLMDNEWIKAVVNALDIPLTFYAVFTFISILLVLVFFIKLIVAVLIQRMILKFGYDQLKLLRIRLMKSYQQSDYEDYLSQNSSKYIYTIEQLTSLYVGKVLIAGLKITSDLVVSISILALLAWVDLNLLLSLSISMIFSIFLYDKLIREKSAQLGKQCNSTSIAMIKAVKEGLEGLKEIRILGREEYFFKTVKENASKYSFNQTKLGVLNATPRYFIEFIMVGFIAISSMVYMNVGGELQTMLSTLAIFGISAIRLIPAFYSVSNGLLQIRSNENTISRIYDEVVHSKEILAPVVIEESRGELFREIEMQNIYFHYRGNEHSTTLKNINLKIKKNEIVGIIGPSGSGKSTLIDILMGLLSPIEGVLLYNKGRLTKKIKIWRSKVSYLPQKIFLIDGTIEENVALGVEKIHINREKVNESVERAKLKGAINQLPNGLETIVGEGGAKISGGQKQRIALARAFYHDREVLIMDEPTSALDKETEQEISSELDQFKGRLTIVIVAHSFSILKRCDRIYRIDKGSIVEETTYEKLINNEQIT